MLVGTTKCFKFALVTAKDATCQRERPFVPASRKKNRSFKKARTGLRPKQSGHSTGHPGHGTGHLDEKKRPFRPPERPLRTKSGLHTHAERRQTTSPVEEHRTKMDCEDGTPKPKKSGLCEGGGRAFTVPFYLLDRLPITTHVHEKMCVTFPIRFEFPADFDWDDQ